jgi:hypothetical protein
MALRIRYQHASGSSIGYSIERLADGLLFDFASSVFSTTPGTPIAALPEDTGIFAGRYKVTLSPTPPAQFADGNFAVTIHDLVANNVAGQLEVLMHSGDDAPVFSTGAGGVDPWSVSLPGAYAPGSAGAILGQNLDAKVSTRSTYAGGAVASVTSPVTVGTNNDKAGYGLAQAFPANFASLAIASGAVTVGAYAQGQDPASLVLSAPANKLSTDGSGRVTAGTVADKAGYSLAPNGLDAIAVENGINARQALSPILAASAGVVTGAGTGTIVIRGANVTTSRITATTDNAGNRSSVTLSLPA